MLLAFPQSAGTLSMTEEKPTLYGECPPGQDVYAYATCLPLVDSGKFSKTQFETCKDCIRLVDEYYMKLINFTCRHL